VQAWHRACNRGTEREEHYSECMAVRLGKYSQSLCTSAQKYMLCAKILVVLRRNKVTAQKYLYTCAEITSVRRNVGCAPKS
jgi:hypothetical protein